MGKTIVAGGGRATVPISGIKAAALSVGSVVKLMESGTEVEYLVVHQGLPSSMYDESCNGCWLLRKDIYESRAWHSSNVNNYANSTIHSYLNSTFLGLLDANIQPAIKQVKLPYRKGSGYGTTITSGASGLAAKIFLLSGYEVGFTQSVSSYFPIDGAKLDYFVSGNDSTARAKRIANLNGLATYWWLRSPCCDSGRGSTSALSVRANGSWDGNFCSDSYGIRPALILPSNAVFDKNTLIFKGVA